MSLCIFLNTNNADNTNIIFAHGSHSHGCLFAAVRSQFFEHEIRRRHTDRMEVITRMTRIFFCTRISPITRIFVCVGTLTWGLLNENDTNEIKKDSIRGLVNTNCLHLVLEIESLYSFSPTIGKNYFHCTHLSKKFKIFTAVHFLCLKFSSKDIFFLISP